LVEQRRNISIRKSDLFGGLSLEKNMLEEKKKQVPGSRW